MRYLLPLIITAAVFVPMSASGIYNASRQMLMKRRSRAKSWAMITAYMMAPMILYLIIGYNLAKVGY